MAESVADKTPTPTVTVRRHIDPPGLWIAIFSCSLMLHASAFLLLRSLSLDPYTPKKTSTAIPIDFIQVRKTRNTQKPQSRLAAKILPTEKRLQSPQTPKISPQKIQPVIPVTPQQDAIAFANPRITKKTAIPTPKTNPKTKPSIKQQAERKVPPKPQVKSQLEQQFERELAQQKRQQQLAERQRQQEISAQQRQQKLAEQQFQRQIAEQQRQQELAQKQRQQEISAQQRQQKLAEQQFQRQIVEQQRQQELAERQRQQEITEQQRQQELAEKQRQRQITEQQRQQELAERQRQQELAERQRQQEIAEQQRQNDTGGEKLPTPPDINKTAPDRGRIIKPGEKIAIGEGKPLDENGGFLTANLSVPGKEEQDRALKVTINGSYAEPLVNRQKSLRSLDGELITQPINCPAWLFINDQGRISEPTPGSPGILVLPKGISERERVICQKYAEEYFKDAKFKPAVDKDGKKPPMSQLLVNLKIQPNVRGDRRSQ
jgi:hypothetical protein